MWRGHPGLQDPRILTLNSGRSWTRARSWTDKSDRESSSQRWTASRSDAGQRLHSIQWKCEENDPRHGQRGILRIMRDWFTSGMFILYILLGRRQCIQYLWNLPVSYGCHSSAESKTIWCLIDFKLRDWKGMFSRSSTSKSEEQLYKTQVFNAWKRCRMKKDAQGENYKRNSGQILGEPALWKITRRTWMRRSEMCRNGQVGRRRLHLQVDEVRVSAIFIKLVTSTQQFRKWRSDGYATWLSRSSRIENSPAQKFGRIVRSQSHHKIKTEYEKETHFKELTVKDVELTRKLGGHCGHRSSSSSWCESDQWDWKEY